jgi:hypothetical protein
MEAVEKIEFTRDLVPHASGDTVNLDTRIEGPSRLAVVEIAYATDIAIVVSLSVILCLGIMGHVN